MLVQYGNYRGLGMWKSISDKIKYGEQCLNWTYSNHNISAADCSILLEFGTEFVYVAPDILQTLKVKCQAHCILSAWRNISAVKTLQVRNEYADRPQTSWKLSTCGAQLRNIVRSRSSGQIRTAIWSASSRKRNEMLLILSVTCEWMMLPCLK